MMRRCLTGVLGALQAAAALALVLVVVLKLENINWNSGFKEVVGDIVERRQCALGTADGMSLCTYAYAVSGLSLAATLVVALLRCCTCDLCGLGIILDLVISAVGTAWWTVASVVFLRNAEKANDAGMPLQDWRTVVVVVSWTSVALFGLMFLMALFSVLSKTCKCFGKICGCCGDDEKGTRSATVPKGTPAVPVEPYGVPPTSQTVVVAGPPPKQQFITSH